MLARNAARKASRLSPSPAPASIKAMAKLRSDCNFIMKSMSASASAAGVMVGRQFGQFREAIQCALGILSEKGVGQGLFRRKKPIERAESRPERAAISVIVTAS